jgi:hypothetical protein
MRRIGVEEAAAVGAQHLDGFLRATGPCAMVCTVPSSVVTLVYGSKFWMTPCEQSNSAATMEIGSRM